MKHLCHAGVFLKIKGENKNYLNVAGEACADVTIWNFPLAVKGKNAGTYKHMHIMYNIAQ